MDRIEYLSFGAGPPSVALMILNALGEVKPKAEAIIFADTGAEKRATYNLLPYYESWANEFSIPFYTTQSKDGSLTDYIREKSVVIPVFTDKGIGRRQCTDHFKIRAIREFISSRYGKVQHRPQLAMTNDFKDVIRVKASKYKDTFNRYPLIELGVDRQECINIIHQNGLPLPPWSACKYCPLQNDGVWRMEAAEHSADFEEAIQVDDNLPNGKSLHWSRKRLATVYSSDQLAMDFDPTGGGCESGYCFT